MHQLAFPRSQEMTIAVEGYQKTLRLSSVACRLAFRDFAADSFVFDFAGFVYGNVRSFAVGDAAFFAVEFARRQFG
jgi:hypothetical protein